MGYGISIAFIRLRISSIILPGNSSVRPLSRLPLLGLVFGALFFATFGQAQAAIVWDYSPATTGATVTNDYWTNQTTGQNFAEAVSFAQTTVIDGMDIYMATSFGALGQTGTIRLWSDNAGAPGLLLSSFTELVTAVDNVGASPGNHRIHVDFTNPLILNAGVTYWIGLSGTSASWTQTGLANVQDSRMAQFNGGTFVYFTGNSVGDMAFRLSGAQAAVPEPASMLAWGLIAGVGAVGYRLRKREVVAAA